MSICFKLGTVGRYYVTKGRIRVFFLHFFWRASFLSSYFISERIAENRVSGYPLFIRCALTGSRCAGKLKAPVVRHKSFELERKGWSFFQADQTRIKMNFSSLCRRGKSSRGFEFWRENGLAARLVRNGSVQPWLRLMKVTTKISKTPKNDETAQKDNRNRKRWVYFLYFIEKKVKFYFVVRFYSTLF